MRYGLGIDLGTTFTAAAVCGESGTRVVPLGRDVVAPSTVFSKPDGTLLTGDAAEEAAVADPARVSRGHKRKLGDPTPLVIGGVAYAPAALLAAQLRDVVTVVTAREGAPPAEVVLTCPAVWGPYRREHFEEVHRLAGLTEVRVVTEPEAAATHYSVERRLGDGELIAVYDLGGGTFDATVLRARGAGMEILGTPEGVEQLGGMDFDAAMLAHLDARLDGALTALDPASPDTAATLAAARASCVRAKEVLSTEPDVTLSVPLPAGTRQVVISRLQFNDMVRHSVSLTTEALHRTINSARLRSDNLAGVLLAGGSSRIPLVSQMVSATFGKPIHATLHPKLTVALGAAAIARRTGAASSPARRPAVSSVVPVPAAPLTLPTRARRPVAARKRRWLGVAAVLAVAAVGTTAVLASGDDPRQEQEPQAAPVASSQAPASSAVNTSPARQRVVGVADLEVYRGREATAYRGMLGSAEDEWAGKAIGDGGTASYQAISAAPEGPTGMRVTWSGTGPGQVYLQHTGGGSDLGAHADAGSALVVDLVVHQQPTAAAVIGVHCVYPCAAELDATRVLRRLSVGTGQSVKIPVECFTAAGVDPKKVNTPFLLTTAGRFDVTIRHVRWVAGAAGDPDATPCGDLR
ncbi:Hsp70 family protein [Actinosynnema sp. CA-299493]